MKYFIDTEFIEDFHKPLFGKRRHFIDLISIGIVAEDGREYYAISNEFKRKNADLWVKENVIPKLNEVPFVNEKIKTSKGIEIIPVLKSQKQSTKNNNTIIGEVKDFFGCWRDQHFWIVGDKIEIYGYYADYDWVLFCSLFGRMIDLPKGFPMYCKDLKQYFDDAQLREKYNLKEQPDYPKQKNEHNALDDARWNFKLYKFLQKCKK